MDIYFLYDSNGFFIGDSLVKTLNSTEISPPQPCWKPKFDIDTQIWIETATSEEMNPSIVPQEPTLTERVEANENLLLEILLMG